MFSRSFLRAVAVILVAVQVSNCAEFDRRGGIVDQIEDFVLFRADTKTHRLMRSYLLATVLLAASRRQGHNDIDRTAISGALEGALAVANEAYLCLYPARSGASSAPGEIVSWSGRDFPSFDRANFQYNEPKLCQFFDEKMARLDYALYRLATVTLFNEESRLVLGDIRTKLVGKIPVLSDAAVAAVHANKALNQATTILDDLLNLAFNSFGPTLALLPLYRDSLELNMWVIADNARIICSGGRPANWIDGAGPSGTAMSYTFSSQQEACNTLGYAIEILQRGNGNVKLWREFIRAMNGQALHVEAYPPHFFLVSQLLIRSCKVVLADATKPERCKVVLKDALEAAIDASTSDFVDGNRDTNRVMTASLPLPGAQFAFSRPRQVRPSDPHVTSSINSQQVQQQNSPGQAPVAPAAPPPATVAPGR